MNAQWFFRKHRPVDDIDNPLGTEHFSDTDEDWRPGEVLVRECIQNSIDAHREYPVNVVFQVYESGSMSREIATRWFDSLWPHLRSTDCKLVDVPRQPEAGGFIVIEDFGTSGLEGDVRQGELTDAENRFFNFFRARGLSGNPMDGHQGGSWGIGKSVFCRASMYNTFLALSVRRNTRDTVLIGNSLLWHHRMPDGQYHAPGRFGVPDPSLDMFVLPVMDRSIIEQFARDFRLYRPIGPSDCDPGLSVVIPYPDPDITADGIVEIVIREYFYPIIAGRLQVSVTGVSGGSRRRTDLTAESIFEHADRFKRSDILKVLELARWALQGDGRTPHDLALPESGRAPQWSDDLLAGEGSDLDALAERFQRGEPVSIRVPVTVRPTGDKPQRSFFVAHLQRDLDGSGYKPVFVRNWIVVPNARKRQNRGQSLFSLIVVQDKALAAMLRAAEPPSHDEWKHDTGNFRGRFAYGKQVIEFVTGASRFLAEALSAADTERDYDVWADFFPMPDDDEGNRDQDGTRRKGWRRNVQPAPPPTPRLKPFRIEP